MIGGGGQRLTSAIQSLHQFFFSRQENWNLTTNQSVFHLKNFWLNWSSIRAKEINSDRLKPVWLEYAKRGGEAVLVSLLVRGCVWSGVSYRHWQVSIAEVWKLVHSTTCFLLPGFDPFHHSAVCVHLLFSFLHILNPKMLWTNILKGHRYVFSRHLMSFYSTIK